MSHASFDSLPNEVLNFVCDHLNICHPPSLKALTLVNKRLHHIARSLQVQQIIFIISSPEKLERDISKWTNILTTISAHRRVRLVEVQNPPAGDTEETYTTPLRYQIHSPKRAEYHQFLDGVDEESWQPLADFLSTLPALSHFMYLRPGRKLPQCILTFLEKTQNRCKLHVEGLSLPNPIDTQIDARDLALLPSPFLHSIQIVYPHESDDDYQLALRLLLTSPNLKTLCVEFQPRPSSNTTVDSTFIESNLLAWTGLLAKNESTLKKSESLTYLLINCGRHPPPQPWLYSAGVMDVANNIDFDRLKVLRIQGINLLALVEMFSSFKCTFKSLHTLALTYGSFAIPNGHAPPFDYIRNWLLSINPLRTVELSAHGRLFNELYAPLLSYHGSTLRKLFLVRSPFETSRADNMVTMICNNCPLVEDLTLSLQRTCGEAPEVFAYRKLGSLPQLEELKLHFRFSASPSHRCSVPSPLKAGLSAHDLVKLRDEEFGLHDRPAATHTDEITFLNAHSIHDLEPQFFKDCETQLINAAVDERLAREIFATISEGKPQGSRPLQKLTIESIGDWYYSICVDMIREYLRELGRSWVLSRSVRDDAGGEIEAVWQYTKHGPLASPLEPLHPVSMYIFRGLWPRKVRADGEINWRKDWSSFPLDKESRLSRVDPMSVQFLAD